MILEQKIPVFADWIYPATLNWLFAVGILLAVALLVGLTLSFIWYGPSRFFVVFGQVLRRGLENVFPSPFRTWAVTRLTMKESIRRRVLLVIVFFLLILLGAGWVLNTTRNNPAELYLAFVMVATTALVLLLSLFLSAFSLPTDFKAKTIYTVVTKPIRSSEIILGRILGIGIIGTFILLLMGGSSYVFMTSGLAHSHYLSESEDLTPVPVDSGDNTVDSQRIVFKGETQMANGHRHAVTVFVDGRVFLEPENGHTHYVSREDRGDQIRYWVEREQGTLQARNPIYCKSLNYRKTDGMDGIQGINVGDEWEYRSYISGPEDGAKATPAAIFCFENFRESYFDAETLQSGLPLEITMGVFRSHKGDIQERINASLAVRNPESGLMVELMTFSTEEFGAKVLLIPRQIKGTPQIVQRKGIANDAPFSVPSDAEYNATMQDVRLMQQSEFDFFSDFVTEDGAVEIWLQCLDSGQYLGVAQTDLYFRTADASVVLNFMKGYYKIWMQMVILISFGVLFSTFLSGPVAMISSIGVLIAGFSKPFLMNLAYNRELGGNVFESFYRMVTQQNMVTDLPMTMATQFIKAADVVMSKFLWVVGQAIPPLSEYAVYEQAMTAGFNIPMDWVLVHSMTTFAYAIPLFIIAYLILSNREVAK